VPVLWTIAGTQGAVKESTCPSPAGDQLPWFETVTPHSTPPSRRLTHVDGTDTLNARATAAVSTAWPHLHSTWMAHERHDAADTRSRQDH
jgi:hypothetical protein